MGRYEIAKLVLGILIICLGVFMLIFPDRATKKSNRENPECIAKTKKSGVIEIVIGILFLLLMFI